MADSSRILIVTAVRIEALAVARILGLRRQSKNAWASGDVALAIMGIRAVRLTQLPIPAQGVIAAGVAGGLLPGLEIGEVVIDELSHGISTLPNVCAGHIPVRIGKIASITDIAATPSDKARLFTQTNALAVEMENQHVRDWAAKHNLAYCGIRGISDTAEHTLDPAMLGLVDEVGSIKAGAVARLLLTRPAMIGPLKELGANTKQAANAAAQVVKQLLSARWP